MACTFEVELPIFQRKIRRTVAYNFFNRADYFTSLFKHLPEILDDFFRIPGWQEQLGVKWTSSDFAFNRTTTAAGCEPRPGEDDPLPGKGAT